MNSHSIPFLVKSLYIFSNDFSDPFSGYILISSKFEQIIPESQINPDILSKYPLLDFSFSFIFPGIIDLNTKMNSFYEENWFLPEEVTKMAIRGGITTIIENPGLHKNEENSEINLLKNRKNSLKNRIYTDVGLLSYIGKNNYNEIESIYDNEYCLGFKFYLSRPYNSSFSCITINDLQKILKKIRKNPKFKGIFLAFDCIQASDRELFLISPLRKETKEKRLNFNFDIRNSSDFAGGVQGEISDTEHDYLSDNEIDEMIISYEIPTKNRIKNHEKKNFLESFKTKAKMLAKSQEESSIAVMELTQYSQKSEDFLNSAEIQKDKITDTSLETLENTNSLDNNSSLNDFSENDINLENGIDENSSMPNLTIKKKSPILITKKILSAEFKGFNNDPMKLALRSAMKQNFDSEEIKEISNEDTEKNNLQQRNSAPSKLLSRRLLNSVSVLSNFEDNNKFKISGFSNKTVHSFDLTKINELKVEKEINLNREKELNIDYNIFLSNHCLAWESKGVSNILKTFKKMENTNLNVLFMNLSANYLILMCWNAKEKFNKLKNIEGQNKIMYSCTEDIKSNDKILNNNLKHEKTNSNYEYNEKQEKLNIFTEVITPNLYFHCKKILKTQTKFKNSPPIRIPEERTLFVNCLKEENLNLIDCVSSGHFSVPKQFKYIDKGNFRRSFGGYSSIGLNLNICWTQMYCLEKKYNFCKTNKLLHHNSEEEEIDEKIKNINENIKKFKHIFLKIIKILSVNPANIAKLKGKGQIKENLDADFFVWNPFKKIKITDENIDLNDKDIFIYRKKKFYGEITHTFLRGNLVFQKENNFFEKKGEILIRNF